MRLLIVDDSAIVRAIITQNLKKYSDIEIVDSVSTGRKAVDSARSLKPDIVLSDISMPEMNGIESTKIITSELRIPVVILSEDVSLLLEAKTAGACTFVEKPDVKNYNKPFFENLYEILKKFILMSGTVNKRNVSNDSNSSSKLGNLGSTGTSIVKPKILCLGASTGGPTAVASVLSGLGKNFPLPIIYSQHIEIGADVKMSEWLDSSCPNIHVKLAQNGEEAVAGNVYMAPADKHLIIDFVKLNGNPVLKISDDPPERFLRPAVNKMFVSASQFYKKNCLAVLLTGMGRDGADGCKKILDAGGYTIVEDCSTCVVFGMPAAAIEVGGATEVLPRNDIPTRILELVKS